MKQPTRLFDFTEKEWKFIPSLSGEMAFYFFETFWLPLEMFQEEMTEKMKNWTPQQWLNILDTDLALWKEEQLTK